MRKGVWDAGPFALEQLTHAQLVRWIDDRPDQADGDRFRLQPARLLDRAEDALLVEIDEDVSLRVDAPTDLEGQVPGHVGRGVRKLTEGLELATFAEEQDVGKALGREEGGA